jgi:hypothetical protein
MSMFPNREQDLKEYLRQAAVARTLAEKAASTAMRDSYLKLADEWQKLADAVTKARLQRGCSSQRFRSRVRNPTNARASESEQIQQIHVPMWRTR